jgi:hypothetical protein
MAKALDDLRASPAVYEAGADDRSSFLHPARFLAGPVCSLRQLWLLAREVIGLGPLVALSGYDLETLGLDGCVTTKGWQLIHDPANHGLKLKFFSSVNVGSSSLNTKRLTLADGESAIDVSDSLREIMSLEDYKNALRTLSKAMHLALPWNHSVNAIEGFMHATNFCAKELGSFSTRPHLLAIFTDHVLNANSKRWVNKQEFLRAADLRPFFDQWAGSRSLNVLSARAAEPPGAEDPQAKHRTFHNRNKNSYKPYSNVNTGSTKPGSDKPKEPELCRRYNAGTCPNSHRDCTTGQHRAGEKLLHLCSYEDSKGRVCRGRHAKQDHRDRR